jgi:hypothetical protein
MKFRTMLCLALCSCLVGGTVWAKDAEKKGKKKQEKIDKRFEEIDTNKDGSISKEEFEVYEKEHHGKHEKKDK